MMNFVLKTLKVLGIVVLSLILMGLAYVIVSTEIGNSQIKANIDGLGTKLMLVRVSSLDRTEYDFYFTYAMNDEVNVAIPLKKKSSIKLSPIFDVFKKMKTFRSKRMQFFLEPDSTIIIKGETDDLSTTYEIVRGNELSYQENELRKVLLPYYEEESRLYHMADVLEDSNPEESRRITKQFDSLRFFVVAPLRIQWAKEHPEYGLSARHFYQERMPEDTSIKYYHLLTDEAAKSEYGQILGKMVNGFESTKIGKIAPNFTHQTYTGKDFSIENLRGKYVVLDFWGTWCGPCIKEIPRMKELYNKHKDRLEIVGIAHNDTREDWEEVIKEKNLDWVHILDEKSPDSSITSLYGVLGFPTKFILDKKGSIVGKYIGLEDEFYVQVDSLIAAGNSENFTQR